jgi:GT2 family glycosyltransferase
VKLLSSLHKRIHFLPCLDTREVQSLLHSWAPDTLVVIPSIDDNYPYVVIEASLIPGLNAIYSNAGGMREILPSAAGGQFFDPFERPLADTLRRWLLPGPRPQAELCSYDWNHHNRQWLDFHERVCRATQPQPKVIPISSKPNPQVDVCIPFFNHGRYLPQLLEALERQTVPPCSVTVVDDGSTEVESQTVFAEMSRRYSDKRWRFESSAANRGVSAARNVAATKGYAKHLLFLDADNVPAAHMIERLLSAIENSGDDCMTCYFRVFQADYPPCEWTADGADKGRMRQTVPTKFEFLPLGACLTLGLFDNFFGDASFIVRRTVFESLGGFSEERKLQYATHEDYDFLLRLVLAGHKLDVLPEVLFFYRLTDGGLSKTTDKYRNRLRVHRTYARVLRDAGLPGLVPYLYGLYERGKPLEFLMAEVRGAFRHPFKMVRGISMAVIRRLLTRDVLP